MPHLPTSILRRIPPACLIVPTALLLAGCAPAPETGDTPGERLSGTFELHLVRTDAAASGDVYFKAIVDFDSLLWREIGREPYLPGAIPEARPRRTSSRSQNLAYEFEGTALRLELWAEREVQNYGEPARRERITYVVEGRFPRREGADLFGPFRGTALVTGSAPFEELRQIFRGEAVGYCLSGGGWAGCLRVYGGR